MYVMPRGHRRCGRRTLTAVSQEDGAGAGRSMMAAPDAPYFSIALTVFGVLDAIAPYVSNAVGLPLSTLTINEVVDHVVPAAIVVGIAWWSLLHGRRSLAGSLVTLVAGTWMFATHVPLIVQAAQGLVPVQTALIHSTPGALVLLTALMVTLVDLVAAYATRPA